MGVVNTSPTCHCIRQVWQVISNFAFSLVECAPAALLAGLLKTESLFDLDA